MIAENRSHCEAGFLVKHGERHKGRPEGLKKLSGTCNIPAVKDDYMIRER